MSDFKILGVNKQEQYITQTNIFEDLLEVVQQTDKENWSWFTEEDSKGLAIDFLDFGNFSKVIYLDKNPIAFIQLYLLKPNAPTLLKNDTYKKLGLSLEDLKAKDYFEHSIKDFSKFHLYVNVVAVKQEYKGSIKLLFSLLEAIEQIIQENFEHKERPEYIFATGVSSAGNKMCRLAGMEELSVSECEYVFNNQHIKHKRTLYFTDTTNLLFSLNKLKRED